MGDFKKLHVWRKAHALAIAAHRVAATLRGSKHAALRNQLIRAAMSIATNIVEGRGQKSDRDFARFLGYSINSTAEFEYHTIVGRDTDAIRKSDAISLLAQAIEIRKMLHGLIARLESGKGRSPGRKVPAS